MDTNHSTHDPELLRLVDALVSWEATASQIVAHMLTYPSTSTESPVHVFSRLIAETVEPVIGDDLAALANAASLIEKVDATIGAEIYLVAPPNRAARRARRRGSH